MAPKQSPQVHPKAPATGKGTVQRPPNTKPHGNHVPKTGK